MRMSKIKGNPCITISNQSAGCIPEAPPKIHFNFPHICGSGKKGAKPRVRQAMIMIRQLFRICILFALRVDYL